MMNHEVNSGERRRAKISTDKKENVCYVFCDIQAPGRVPPSVTRDWSSPAWSPDNAHTDGELKPEKTRKRPEKTHNQKLGTGI